MNKFFCSMHSRLLLYCSLMFTLVLLTTNQPVQANAATTCLASFDVTNTGCSEVHVYWWQGNGDPDVWYATLQPGETWWADAYEGTMWTFYDVGASDWMPMYTMSGCNAQSVDLNTSGCGGNTGNTGACVPNCNLLNTNVNGYMYLGEYNNHAYYKKLNGDVEYWTALNHADQLGGYLVSITSQAEQNFVYNAAGGSSFWLGLNDANNEGNFQWLSGENSNYTNWASNEPNDEHPNGWGADYVRVKANGKWADDSDNAYHWAVIEVDCPCQPAPAVCDGEITGFQLNPQDGSGLINLTNGAVFCESDFSNDIRIRANASGSHESLRFTITGGANVANTENVVTYDSNQFWANPGTYVVHAELYSEDNLGGQSCDEASITFTVIDCSQPPVDPMGPTCDLSVNAGNNQTVCPGETVTLTASSSGQNDCSCCTREVSNTVHCGNGTVYGIFLNGGNGGEHYQLTAATWTECSDGTAHFSGTAWGNGQDIEFSFDFSGATTTPPANSPKDNNCGNNDPWGWVYYTGYTGTVATANHGTYTASGNGPAFQLGNGANQTSSLFGGSGWLTLSGGDGFYTNGDININLGDLNCPNGGNNNVTYAWSNGATGSSITVNPNSTTTYTVTATDCAGCSATDNVTVNVENDLEATASNNGSLTCANTSVDLMATGGGSYAWTGPGGFTSNQQNPSVTAPGTYTVNITSATGCTGSATTTVQANTNAPTASASNNGPITCNSSNIVLSATGGGSYAWTGPGGFASNMQNPTINVAGTYTVTVTNANGCTDSASTNVGADSSSPSASATGGEVCDGGNIQLTASGGGTYFWNGPNGYMSSMQNPTVSASGTYTVTVTGANGCSDQASATVTINNITATASNNGPLTCNTTSVQLTSAGGGTYAWTGPGGFASNQQNPSVTAPGTYTVTVSQGGCTATASTTVQANTNAPTATASNNGPLTCNTASVQLSATGGGAYAWTGPNGFASNMQSPSVTSAGTYTVTVTNANGCTATASTTVQANLNTPTASATGGEFCAGENVQLTSFGGGSYAWTGPGGFASTQQNPTVSTAGTYTVTVTNANGCTAQATATVTEVVINSGINVAGMVCANEPLSFAAINNGFGSSYAWTFAGDASIATSNNPNPTVSWASAGIKNVTLTVLNAGCSEMYNAAVMVTEEVFAIAGDDRTICQGEATQLGGMPTGPAGAVYVWTPAAGLNNTGAANPMASPLATTTYTVTVTKEGCVDTDQVTVLVGTEECLVDVELTKSVSQPTAMIGEEVDWTITVLNKGPADATSVTVTDALPAGLTFVGSNTSAGSFNAGSLTWIIGNLASGQSETLTVTTTVNQVGTFVNTAQVATHDQDDVDSQPGNDNGDQSQDDEDNAQVTVIQLIDLELTKDVNATVVTEGDNVVWTISVSNEGPSVATGVTVADNLPAGLTFVSANATQGAFNSNNLIWTIGTLNVNQSETLQITTTVAQAGNYTNVAEVVGANENDIDSQPNNNDGDESQDDEDNASITGEMIPLASLGDKVFVDLDGDGLQDPGEPGVAGVTVMLLDGNGNMVTSMMTDANGNYLFNNLTPGSYKVKFPTDVIIAGDDYTLTAANQGGAGSDALDSDAVPMNDGSGNAMTQVVTLGPGDQNLTLDAGYVLVPELLGSLGDKVFFDLDGDGIQDPGEPGVSGVTVMLLDGNGNMITSMITDGSGNYLFTGLMAGTYKVKFPDGVSQGGEDYALTIPFVGGNDAIDSNAVPMNDGSGNAMSEVITLGPGDNILTIDAGYLPLSRLGDKVFVDEDGDGIQDPGEPGVPGVTVMLLDGSGAMVSSTVTDAAGNYIFEGLFPGDYKVKFPVDVTIAGDPYTLTAANQGGAGSDAADSDAVPMNDGSGNAMTQIVTLGAGDEDLTLDAGYVIVPPETAGLGNFVFQDFDADGMYMPANGDAPLAGIVVNLYDATDLNTVLATFTTLADGMYQFTGLDPSLDYVVEFGDLSGFVRSPQASMASAGVDDKSDAAFFDGFTDVIDLNPGEFDPTIDAGYTPFRGIITVKALLEGPAMPALGGKSAGDADPLPLALKSNDAIYMHDDLHDLGLIPTANPYNGMSKFNHTGNETMAPGMMDLDGSAAIVDWALVEVRDANDASIVVASKAVFACAGGKWIDADGNEEIVFEGIDDQPYFVSVCHRNHFPVFTASAISITGATATALDFTDPTITPTYGDHAQVQMANGMMAMRAGASGPTHSMNFQGPGADNGPNNAFFAIITDAGNTGALVNFESEQYHMADFNLDGKVSFQGASPDLDANGYFFGVLAHPANSTFSPNYTVTAPKPW